MIDNKTSLLIPYQLPEFIRENPDYDKFILFLQAYYEWMEETGNVTDRSKNILNYIDIDRTSTEFLDYFYNDFLSYFPIDVLADKRLVTKIAKELYKNKGTESAYKFLFRILYNSDVEFFYTKDAVLKASSGKWYVSKSLKLKSSDPNFLSTNNYRVFGEETRSIAVIENSVFSKNKTELFISNIERLFQSGEFVRIVDNNNQTLYFKDGQVVPADTVGATILRAKIVGQISQININTNFRGEQYITGDPVVVYNGLDTVGDVVGAVAAVGETTLGSIKRISVDEGGYGYPYHSVVYNSRTGNVSTLVTQTADTTIDITGAPGAVAIIGSINPDPSVTSNVTFIAIDYISSKAGVQINASDYAFQSYVTNVNSTIANTLNFVSFAAWPITSVLVQNQGGGVLNPTISANAKYSVAYDAGTSNLRYLGILAPIQIINGGTGYRANDRIVFSGGSGYGAYANVITVDPSTNAITSVAYVYPSANTPPNYSLGGMGFRKTDLPTLSVTSANTSAANAILQVTGILGEGAKFTPITDRAGSVTTINISNYGEDYIAAPNVSLRVQDIVVTNVIGSNAPQSGDVVYQGSSFENSSFSAIVDSLTLVAANEITTSSKYILRVYNYTSVANNAAGPLIVDSRTASMLMNNTYVPAQPDTRYNQDTGVLVYGNGTAKATAKFLNGLVISQGQYLDTTGQPSSFDILQSENYNNFTYEITVEKEIEKYRKILLDLLHPTGLKVFGRYAINTSNSYSVHVQCGAQLGHTLGYYTGNPASSASMVGDFTNQSNNIVHFSGLSGADIEGFIFPNESSISLTDSYGQLVYSGVVSVVSGAANNVILQDNVWLTFANVASITGVTGADRISVDYLTGSYDIINNREYSNTSYPLYDIVHAGDKILFANNTVKTVSSVNPVNSTIILTTTLTNNSSSLMSVNRNVSTVGVTIVGPLGVQYYPELITEDGDNIAAEDGSIILIG